MKWSKWQLLTKENIDKLPVIKKGIVILRRKNKKMHIGSGRWSDTIYIKGCNISRELYYQADCSTCYQKEPFVTTFYFSYCVTKKANQIEMKLLRDFVAKYTDIPHLNRAGFDIPAKWDRLRPLMFRKVVFK